MPRAAIVVVGAVLAIVAFLAFPTPLLGVDGATLSHSIESSILGTDPCERDGEAWRCSIWKQEGSSAVEYRVTVDGFGCWVAERAGRSPAEKTGCIDILDHVRLADRL